MSPPDSNTPEATVAPVASSSPIAALRHGHFRTIWIAQLFSNFGGMVQGVGAAWLMTLLIPSPDWVAGVQAATSLPLVLFSMLGGAVADLWDRRLAMMAAQCWMLLAATVLAVVTGLGATTPILLLAMTFALGSGQAFSGPAWQASISQIVPRADLPSAIALGGMGFNLARSLGPALGGIIVGTLGPQAAFLYNAFSFLGVIFGLLRWRRTTPVQTLPREHLFYAIVTGIRYVSAAPGIRAVIARSTGFAMHSSAILALLPLVAKDSLSGGPVIYGMLLGAFGAGGVMGAFFSVRLRNQAGTDKVLMGSTVVYAVASMVVGWVPSLWVDMIVLMGAGAAWMMSNSSCNFSVQMLASNWVKARSLSIYQTCQFSGNVAGAWLWGHVATAYGVPTALLAAGLFGLLTLTLALRYRAPSVDNIDLTPADPTPLPSMSVAVTPDSGPILITLEYTVPPDRSAAFMQAMREVRRIRRRDGAIGWGLYQDLSMPERWTESYELPTWTDLLRLRERRTMADAAAYAKARACHVGESPPVISRMLMQAPAHRIGRKQFSG